MPIKLIAKKMIESFKTKMKQMTLLETYMSPLTKNFSVM